MSDEFRSRAMAGIARLLTHWRTVEMWIKRAELVSGNAVIPAINELRYASRQLINAMRIYNKDELSPGERHVIEKRIIIAEQYLLNAEHDICDAIITFYRRIVNDLDQKFGKTRITIIFNEYPLLISRIKDCSDLITRARHEYEDRAAHYKNIRENYLEKILSAYGRLVDAEIAARETLEQQQYEIKKANATINSLTILSIIASLCAIVAIPLSIYLWMYGKEEVCRSHVWLKPICGSVRTN